MSLPVLNESNDAIVDGWAEFSISATDLVTLPNQTSMSFSSDTGMTQTLQQISEQDCELILQNVVDIQHYDPNTTYDWDLAPIHDESAVVDSPQYNWNPLASQSEEHNSMTVDPRFLVQHGQDHSGMTLLSAGEARIGPMFFLSQKIGLFRRREQSFGSQLRSYYLLQTMRSYPKAICSGGVPPFIHEKCGGFGIGVSTEDSLELLIPPLQEPLAVCQSILTLYFSKTMQSVSFVWRSIEAELDRLAISFSLLDEWALISALQAVTIYILLATLEEDNLSPGIDARMLHVMMSIAAKIQDPAYTIGISQYGEWDKWILAESRDRVFTLLFIINTVFDINPTHDPNACNELLKMPVPAHKSLWNAKDPIEWKNAHDEFSHKRQGRPGLTYRDMVEVHTRGQGNQKQTLEDLDDWFLNLDSFGTFVLMTATSI